MTMGVSGVVAIGEMTIGTTSGLEELELRWNLKDALVMSVTNESSEDFEAEDEDELELEVEEELEPEEEELSLKRERWLSLLVFSMALVLASTAKQMDTNKTAK